MKLTCEFEKVFIRPGFVDGRKGLNSLLAIIVNEMQLQPCDSAIFMFCTKNKKSLRLVYWQRNAFWLATKKLDSGDLWPWPNTNEEATELNEVELKMLLDGIDFWKAHKEKHYSIVI